MDNATPIKSIVDILGTYNCKHLDKLATQLDNSYIANSNNGVPSCWNCMWSCKYPGHYGSYQEQDEPPVTECHAFDIQHHSCNQGNCHWLPIIFAFFELYYEKGCEESGDWEENARPCPLYKPMPVEYCAQCKQPTDKTILNAPSTNYFDTVWFCSDECKKQYDKELDKEIRENGAGCF